MAVDEPVSILVEVRRGKTVLMRMGAGVTGPAIWSAPTPMADIQTPQGPLCEILILPSLRAHHWRIDTSDEKPVPAQILTAEQAAELEEILPF
jgi:hypothetical protein